MSIPFTVVTLAFTSNRMVDVFFVKKRSKTTRCYREEKISASQEALISNTPVLGNLSRDCLIMDRIFRENVTNSTEE